MFTGLLQRIGAGWTRFIGGRRSGLKEVEGGPTSGAMLAGDVSMALQSSAAWSCCRLVSQAVSSLPGNLFEETPDGKVKALKHRYWRMLTLQPNPLMTMPQWRQTTVLHLMLYGNAYSIPEIVEGEVIALWPVPPERVRVVVQADGFYRYFVNDSRGKPWKEFAPLELMHFRLFSLDGIMGLSPVEYHRSTFDIEAASRGFALNLLVNGGRPQGVLEYAGTMSKEQIKDIRAGWKQVHAGPQNAGSIVVLEGGTKYQALGIPPEQMEFIQQQKFSVEQIARIYGVPPHLIAAMDKPTYASVEQQSLEFVQYTLQPIVTSLERTIQTVLLDEQYFYKLNLAAFERSDIKTRYAAYATGRQWGWLSVNDIRELEDMNRIPEGDVYLQPLNMIPASAAGEEPINATRI
jgi:HK97 family phage portal protein